MEDFQRVQHNRIYLVSLPFAFFLEFEADDPSIENGRAGVRTVFVEENQKNSIFKNKEKLLVKLLFFQELVGKNLKNTS